MSASLVVTAIKVVSTAMAVKSAIEGLKEGNLLQAVVGAVGAYMGYTNLTVGSSMGQMAEQGAAGGIAEGAMAGTEIDQLSQSIGNAVTEPVAVKLTDSVSAAAAASGADNALATAGLESAGSNLGNSVLQEGAGQVTNQVAAEAGGRGALQMAGDAVKKAGTFLNENSGAVNFGGQLLTGYAQGKQAEELEKKRLEEEEKERRRRGTSGVMPRTSFDPTTWQLARAN